jgi:type II secretory pathway pseudopilin PulG
MSNDKKRQRGLTLIEAIVSVVIVVIAIVGVLSALGQITYSEQRASTTELMHRLACEKFDEVISTGTYTTAGLNGDFSDYNISGYIWTAEVTPTTETNLDSLEVIVEKTSGSSANQVSVSGLIYTPSTTGTGTMSSSGVQQ